GRCRPSVSRHRRGREPRLGTRGSRRVRPSTKRHARSESPFVLSRTGRFRRRRPPRDRVHRGTGVLADRPAMNSADVFLKDVAVGRLERYEDLQHTFTFEPTWLADPDRPVLGQIFEDRRPRPLTTSGLPCWFAHLLPQGGPLRRFLERACGLEAWDDLGLLLAAGEDLPGAVRVVPAAAGQGPRVPEASVARVPEATDSFGPSFSLAGAQWKLSVRRGERGLVVPVRGELGDWIAKFHDPEHPVLPRVEFATTAWAGRSGIEIPETRLATLEEFHDLPEGV